MDVLFDLDGTLLDPKPGIIASYQFALTSLGLPVPEADSLVDVIGPPLRTSFPRHGVAQADVETALQRYREFYSGGADGHSPAMFNATPYPGIDDTLTALTHAGCRLIVATSKPHVFARPILREKGLAHHFSAIHGAELDGTRDNKVELIAYICQTETIDVAEGVMIGDREFDIVGGRNNGLKTIGATWGYGSVEELRNAGASALCPQPKGLHRLVLWLLTGHG